MKKRFLYSLLLAILVGEALVTRYRLCTSDGEPLTTEPWSKMSGEVRAFIVLYNGYVGNMPQRYIPIQ
jgi:hypothetical protein